ncbi:MAG TPA: hypothetical protein VHZ97_26045 [Pseudonocardiaceae bacterium]|jgi:hypothetical protein|nr:hypothetical protein [Pseudonocardiaceae bacterium]
MTGTAWVALASWLAVALVVPFAWEATRRRRRSAARMSLAAVAVFVLALDLTALLHYEGAPAALVLGVLIGGEALALVMAVLAVHRLVVARRSEREPQVGADQLITAPADLWVRPHPPIEQPGHGPLSRVDAWLAADGPKPSAGWWHNGGLLLDERGPAFVDAAGLRHPLPDTVTAMVNPSVPRSLMLVNDRHNVAVWLPTTGFANPELKDFAEATQWSYTTEMAEFLRDAHDVLDLRRAVVDHLAKDDGTVRRVIRRLAGQGR